MFDLRGMYWELPAMSVEMESALMRAREELDHDIGAVIWGEGYHVWPCDICDRREANSGTLLGRWGDE